MKCLALRHLAFEDLGIFEDVLIQHGFSIEYRQAGVDVLLEVEWENSDLVVVLGGPIGVYETSKYPWLAEEITTIKLRLERKQPILGICLGAQLMAAALGAKVYPAFAKEIGWASVDLTDAGHASAISHLHNSPVLHWHGDTFDLPQGANLLASTVITPHQAFSYGSNALALQFHPEIDTRRIETWLIGHTCELAQVGISVPALRLASLNFAKKTAKGGSEMLNAWLNSLMLSK